MKGLRVSTSYQTKNCMKNLVNHCSHGFIVGSLLLSLLAPLSSVAQSAAPESAAEKAAAAERYFKAVPFLELQQGMTDEIAKQVAPEHRADFVRFMNTDVNWKLIEASARESLSKHLTTAELNAMSDFMDKPEGKSAMHKMKYYMADVMPIIQKELQRAMAQRTPTGAKGK